MAKKNMDILLGNILGNAAIRPQDRYEETAHAPEQEEKRVKSEGKPPSEEPWKHFTFICSEELVDKVQAIARKEGFTIRTFMEYVMRRGIEAYEARHGKVRKIRPKDIKDVM